MIDAYQIGIQLLLQDDVSAGLAVINRGLADVDRAIAATSANLTGLVHEAERAAKAVAVAAGGKIPQGGASEPKSVSGATGELLRPPATDNAPIGTAAAAPVTAMSGTNEQQAAAPSREAVAEVEQDKRTPYSAEPVDKIDAPSAPNKSFADKAMPRERQDAAAPVVASGLTPVGRVEAAPSTSDAPRRGGDLEPVSAGSDNRQVPSALNASLAVTAAIGQSGAGSSPSVSRHQIGPRAGEQSGPGRERAAAAPWSVGAYAAPRSLSSRPAEPAAAPQASARERGEGGGGTVMLDGRLVGQWLSEHMAREASRPPGGTSFFDARQTPAWNVSGAL